VKGGEDLQRAVMCHQVGEGKNDVFPPQISNANSDPYPAWWCASFNYCERVVYGEQWPIGNMVLTRTITAVLRLTVPQQMSGSPRLDHSTRPFIRKICLQGTRRQKVPKKSENARISQLKVALFSGPFSPPHAAAVPVRCSGCCRVSSSYGQKPSRSPW
jgi:hypothetical protein